MVKIVSIIFAFIVLGTVGARQASAVSVWIDTDISIGSPFREVDDAYALVLAFHSPELRIAGISSTYGNGSQAFAQAAAVDLVTRFGAGAHLSGRNVFAGAASADELGRPSPATNALTVALRREHLTYLALGPLTDLATVLRFHPELATRLREVIFVGGVTEPGPIHLGRWPVHDANVGKDPAATKIVLQSGVPMRIIPIATAAHFVLTSSDMQLLASGGPAGRYLSVKSQTWLWFWNTFGNTGGGVVFDALAAMSAARPDLIRFESADAFVDPGGDLVVKRDRKHSQRVQICRAYQKTARDVMVRRLCQ